MRCAGHERRVQIVGGVRTVHRVHQSLHQLIGFTFMIFSHFSPETMQTGNEACIAVNKSDGTMKNLAVNEGAWMMVTAIATFAALIMK